MSLSPLDTHPASPSTWTTDVDIAFNAIPEWCYGEKTVENRRAGIRITDPDSHGVIEAYPEENTLTGTVGSRWLATTWVVGDGGLDKDMFAFAALVTRSGGHSSATSVNVPLQYGDPTRYSIAFHLSSAPGSDLISTLLGRLHQDTLQVRTAAFLEDHPGILITNEGGWGQQLMVEGIWDEYEWFFLREKTYAYLNVGYSGGYPLWTSYANDLPYLEKTAGPLNIFFELFPLLHSMLYMAPYDYSFQRNGENENEGEQKVWWKKAFSSTQARELLENETGYSFTLLQGDDPRVFPSSPPTFLPASVMLLS